METNIREKEMETWAEVIAQFLRVNGNTHKITEE